MLWIVYTPLEARRTEPPARRELAGGWPEPMSIIEAMPPKTKKRSKNVESKKEERAGAKKKRNRSPKRSGASSRRGKGKLPMAVAADRHVCYQLSVQAVDAEIDFVDDTFKDLRGRRPEVIREDFCGTANSSCEFVKRRRTNRAYGVDLDGATLDWGREHNINGLSPAARKRVTLLQENVLTVRTEPVDAVLAMNFSYYTFQKRETLRQYFKNVHRSLGDGGIFFLDCYGGSEAHSECREKRKINKDFTYIWEQSRYSPITGEMCCYIHFHFADGSKMNKAFEYVWRLWTLPEIREVLAEAGFAKTTVYWEGTEEDTNEGNGIFEPNEVGDADPAWIAYIVAEK